MLPRLWGMLSRPTIMTSLVDLPVELLRAICSQLRTNKDSSGHSDVSRLSRTCRWHRDTIQPLVFTAFAPDSNTPVCPRILQLINALILRPDLAQHLKYIDLADIDCDDPLSENESHLLNSIITKLSLQSLDPGFLTKPRPNPLPVIELLLLHTPNVVHLHLALSEVWRPFFLPSILISSRNTTLLPNLITLTLTHQLIYNYHWDLGLPNFLTILRAAAPNLRHLCTDNPGSETQLEVATLTSNNLDCSIDMSIYPPLPNLLHLNFDAVCSLSPDVLRGIVSAAPRLEVFALSTASNWDSGTGVGDSDRDCTVVDVWEVLWLRRETLREVRVDIMGYGNRQEWGRGMEMAVDSAKLALAGSIGEFTRLEVLKVGGYALGVLEEMWRESGGDHDGFVEKLLPRGIQEVTFWEPEGSWMGALRQLAGVLALVKQARFPDLVSVVVAPVPESDVDIFREWKAKEDWLRASGELVKQFQGAGVRFEVQGERGREPAGPFELRNPFQF